MSELRERGDVSGDTMLKRFLASLRPKEIVDPVICFETKPGEQMPVDWAVIRRGENRFSVFVVTLGSSANQIGRFETKWLSRPENFAALIDLLGHWIDEVCRRLPEILVLDVDSSESPAATSRKATPTMAILAVPAIIRYSCSTSSGMSSGAR